MNLWADCDGPRIEVLATPVRDRAPVLVLVPGGAYRRLVFSPHFDPVAESLVARGWGLAKLFYRIAPRCAEPALADAGRAVRLLRSGRAWPGVRTGPVCLLASSAGGHLAAMLATSPDLIRPPDDDLLGTVNARPERIALLWPVISLREHVHSESAESLLGPDPDPTRLDLWSPDRQVGPANPPVLVVHCRDDATVNWRNGQRFAEACTVAGVRSELHLFPDGGHGMRCPGAGTDRAVQLLPNLLTGWFSEAESQVCI